MAPPFEEQQQTVVTAASSADAASSTIDKIKSMQKAFGSANPTSSTSKSTSAMTSILTHLSKDIHAIKKHGNPLFSDVQALADRTWKATITVEAYIEKLNREKEMLNQQIDNIWSDFDVLIRPLWRIDDSIVPIYDTLASLRLQLENLQAMQKFSKAPDSEESADAAQGSFSAEEREADLHSIQERLHKIENEHVIDGKFVGKGWKAGDRVPGGQALVANLLARCYKLVRQLQESEPAVSPRLYPLENRLLNIVSTLEAFKQALISGALIDPIELRILQEHVRDIDAKRVDGKFVDEEGTNEIPEGQAILTGLLEEAYDLIHDCLLEIDQQRGPDPIDEVDALLERVAEVRQIVSGYLVRNPEKREAAEKKEDEVVKEDPEAMKKATGGLLGSSSAALSALRETLGEGYSYVRNTAGKLEEGIATTVSKNTSRLVSAVRSGLSSMSHLLGSVDPVDPSLANVHARLIRLQKTLLRLRNDRDAEETSRFAMAGMGGDSGHLDLAADPARRIEIRTHVAELDEIDSLRDEETGDFVNEEGVAPQGQQVLKSLYEECYLIAYDLIR
ncbi:hypothetical protein HDU67_008605 [Dinochytrium kinnereticum]|nr:hypothetical protein HDU67_008605 [Dinochytrium kinnereticum]